MSEDTSRQRDGGAERNPLGADLVIPALAGAFAVYFFWDTWNFEWEARINVMLIGGPLLVLVAVKLVSVLNQVRKGRADLTLGELVEPSTNQIKRIALIAILFGFALSIETLGLTLCIGATLALAMYTLGARRPLQLLLVPSLTALALYGLFILLLDKRLPYGPVEYGIAAMLRAGGIQ